VEKLMELGLTLGADVPVFVYGYSSWAEGIGEKLEKISLNEQWVVVIKPECHVNTKEIFSAKNLTRNSKSIRIADFIAGKQQNDCVEVVCQRYPSVKDALVALSEFSEARLTGTGACVFAQFDSKGAAVNAYKSLKKNKWQVYLAKSLNESPLFSKLKIGKYIS
jgi:4-diphosphocytidyl-2-C-methyl-D-erythritol kinase